MAKKIKAQDILRDVYHNKRDLYRRYNQILKKRINIPFLYDKCSRFTYSIKI
ncbi:MAG: hypothetical protein QM734_10920 [Cyclobacteriaceae bacterium]